MSQSSPEPTPPDTVDAPRAAEQPEPEPAELEAPKETAAASGEEISRVAVRIEAALMVTDRPLSPAKLSEVLGGVPAKQIRQAIEQLNDLYERTERSFRVEQVAGGWQILTLSAFADIAAGIRRTRAVTKLGPAAMETLAIVAYKQPVLRADVEAIRGVACGEVLRSLMERKLVKIVGRAEELGRPMLYGSTSRFLELFGLASLKDLPPVDQFQPRPPPSEPEPDAEGPAESAPQAEPASGGPEPKG